MDAVDILEQARELIATRGWTQGQSARDKYGYVVSFSDANAVCYCLLVCI